MNAVRVKRIAKNVYQHFGEATRFCLVGGSSAAIYCLIVFTLVDFCNFSESAASVLSYAIVLPINFLFHKGFTFKKIVLSSLSWSRELLGFAMVHVIGFCIAFFAMEIIVGHFDASYFIGLIVIVCTVPIVSFAILKYIW